MHWPNGIEAKGEIRQQFHHVIDIVPTVLEAAGLPEPYSVNGIAQKPIEGTAMNYSFDDGDADDRRTTQYFEMFGNRGIYKDGWTAVTKHGTPWETGHIQTIPLFQDVWELYETTTDWSQAHDLAAEMPEKLAEMKEPALRPVSTLSDHCDNCPDPPDPTGIHGLHSRTEHSLSGVMRRLDRADN